MDQSGANGSSRGSDARVAAPWEERAIEKEPGKGSGKGPAGGGGLFRADGSEVRNPAAFVAKITQYEGGLFTADGREIRNPHAFVAKMDQATGKGSSKGSDARVAAPWDIKKEPGKGSGKVPAGGGGLFRADG